MKFKFSALFVIFLIKLIATLEILRNESAPAMVEVVNKISDEFAKELAVPLQIIFNEDDQSFKVSDFQNLLSKSLMQDLAFRVQLTSFDKIIKTNDFRSYVAPWKFSIILLRTIQDFESFLPKLSPKYFAFQNYFMLVLLDGKFNEIQDIFTSLWNLQIYNAILIYKDLDDAISISTFFPFRSATDCSNTTPVVVNEFINGHFTKPLKHIFPNKMKNLHQCVIRVGAMDDFVPFMKEYVNSKGEIKYWGRDYEILKELSRTLNFKFNFTYLGNIGYVMANKTASGGMKSLLNGESEMVIANTWLKKSSLDFFDASKSYFSERFILLSFAAQELSSIEKLLYPLSLNVWIGLLTCLFIGFSVIFVIKFMPEVIQNFVFGRHVRYPYLNMWIAIFGSTQYRLPGRNFSRYILMNFLIFSLVIRTAYQGKMFQFMQTDMKHADPKTICDLVNKNYTMLVHPGFYDFVADYKDMKMELYTPYFEVWMSNYAEHSETILLKFYSQMIYLLRKNKISNITMCPEAILTVSIVIHTKKDFYLLHSINEKLDYMKSAGLIDFWHSMALRTNVSFVDEKSKRKVLTLNHLSGAFQILLTGCSLSAVVFVLEICCYLIRKLKCERKRCKNNGWMRNGK